MSRTRPNPKNSPKRLKKNLTKYKLSYYMNKLQIDFQTPTDSKNSLKGPKRVKKVRKKKLQNKSY